MRDRSVPCLSLQLPIFGAPASQAQRLVLAVLGKQLIARPIARGSAAPADALDRLLCRLRRLVHPHLLPGLDPGIARRAPRAHLAGMPGPEPARLTIIAAAAAIANARGGRRGMPTITNILDVLPQNLVDEVMEDAEQALKAADALRRHCTICGGAVDLSDPIKPTVRIGS